MRNVFYSVVNDIKFKEQYMECYKTHAEHIEMGISIVCALSSAGAIYAWSRWAQLQFVWSLLLVIAQVVQIVRNYLPYARRLDALKYLIPAMHLLVVEVEDRWYALEALEAPDYRPAVLEFRQRMIDLDIKYLGADPLPDIPYLRSKAEKATQNHRALYLEIMEGGDPCAGGPETASPQPPGQGTRH